MSGGAPIVVGGGDIPSRQSIEATAQSKLAMPQSSCESSLMGIGLSSRYEICGSEARVDRSGTVENK